MKGWWKIGFGVVCGLIGAGIILLVSGNPRGQAIILNPPPTPAPISVHVAGAVARPGVYELPVDSRVQDAVEAAGGLSPDADPQAVNLAAILLDGDRGLMPSKTADQTVSRGQPTSPVISRSNPAPSILELDPLININTASQVELETLPGIGPKTAQKIIAYREANGPFESIEDIQDVSGIGPKTFEDIEELITVDVYK